MKYYIWITCLTIWLLLTSCSQKLYSDVKPGQIIFVKKTLTIPAHSARVMLQSGEIIHESALSLYLPRCWFIANKIKTSARNINPGQFLITSVMETYDTVYQHRGGYFLASLGSADGPGAVEYATEMSIRSETQTGITRLICSHWEDPYDAQHLTLKQINSALGRFAHISAEINR